MWPWRKARKVAKTSPETLEERLDALEGSFRGLKAEWLDTYDKLYRLAGRLDASRRWGEKTPPPGMGEPASAPQNESGAPSVELSTPKPENGGEPRTRRDLLASIGG